MTLEQYSWIATIVNSIANVVFLAVSTTVAIYAYRWHIENARIETTHRHSEDLRHWNELVLDSKDLQTLAATNHRWGSLSQDDVVKMYRYFILLNISVSLFEANKRNAVDKSTYESQMNSVANTTFRDSDFIKQHVFPRGYTVAFREDFVRRWVLLDKNGTLPSA